MEEEKEERREKPIEEEERQLEGCRHVGLEMIERMN